MPKGKEGFQPNNNANPEGRPKKEIDLALVGELCEINCTLEEIYGVLKVDKNTLYARLKDAGYHDFSQFYDQHQSKGRSSLRRAQYNYALNGNTSLLIWLGRQNLGQRELPVSQETKDQSFSTEEKEELYKVVSELQDVIKKLTSESN